MAMTRRRETDGAGQAERGPFDKLGSVADAISRIQPGATVMIGGYLNVGVPEKLLTELVRVRIDQLTVIAADAGTPGKGIGRLISAGLVRRLIAGNVAGNPEALDRTRRGDLLLEAVTPGTLVERIRAAGAGLGGVLTATGLGTPAADAKRTVETEGRTYLLETPLRADVALIACFRSDRAGNLIYKGSARNFNPAMATAADFVVAEAREVYEIGDLDPDRILTPGVYVDMVVED